jgi:hypothetical protein
MLQFFGQCWKVDIPFHEGPWTSEYEHETLQDISKPELNKNDECKVMVISVQLLELTAMKPGRKFERNLEVGTEVHIYAYTDFYASLENRTVLCII